MAEPLSLYARHSLTAENITNFYFLKGLYAGEEKFLQRNITQTLAEVQNHKTNDTPTFETNGIIIRYTGIGPVCEEMEGYLQWLEGTGKGFSYDSWNDFYLVDQGPIYVVCSAFRFSTLLPDSARKLAEVLGTDLESILLCGAKIIVPEDAHSKQAYALLNIKK